MKRWKCTVCKQIFDGDSPPVPCPVCGAGQDAFVLLEETTTAPVMDTDDAIVILGGGVAAVSAAKAVRKRNKTATITMVCREKELPYHRPMLPQIITGAKQPEDILLEKAAFYEDMGIRLLQPAEAVAIDPAEKTISLADGEVLPFTKLLLATGAKPFNPIKHSHGTVPVRVLRSCEDALALREFAPGRHIILVGGGILGLEAACALRKIGAEVTVVEFAPRILPIQTDEPVSAMLQKSLENMGIRMVCGASVSEAVRTGALLADGSLLEGDMILASMGVRSEMDLAVAIGLELSRGVVVDPFMHSSREGIWAAGDCAEYGGKVLAMAGAAVAMGAVAGASMAKDQAQPYQPYMPATTFNIPGFSLVSAGAVGAAGEGAETVVADNPEPGKYAKLYFTDGRLSGALFVGGCPVADVVKALAEGREKEKALALLA